MAVSLCLGFGTPEVGTDSRMGTFKRHQLVAKAAGLRYTLIQKLVIASVKEVASRLIVEDRKASSEGSLLPNSLPPICAKGSDSHSRTSCPGDKKPDQ